MKAFLDEDFLLQNDTAKTLYHKYAETMPIIDYHNHLSPKEIYEDKTYENIAKVWLDADHYKWRAMRSAGVPEKNITGDGTSYEKFYAWASCVPQLFGNPLYHWTALELKRYFGIDTPLSSKNAKEVYEECNKKLKTSKYSVRELIVRMHVKELCTTDDPADSLEYHTKLRNEEKRFVIRPTFRPEKAMNIGKAEYKSYIEKLSEIAEVRIFDFDSLLFALTKRLDFFCETGCRITDHSLEGGIYRKTKKEEVDEILKNRLAGQEVSTEDEIKFKGFLLIQLAKEYQKRNLVMQLHIGAMRNNASRMYEALGADAGFDSQDDFSFARELSALLNEADKEQKLPKTILYCLNPKDTQMLASMIGNFQDGSCPGKLQLGPAWWFLDHKSGMEAQMQALMEYGVFGTFIGMLTDSRSFLSFSRHEYFRRILCNMIGERVEAGEYPYDEAFLGKMVENICYNNIKNYLG